MFIVCFDLSNGESFENLSETWVNEIHGVQKNGVIVLVGLKCDLER